MNVLRLSALAAVVCAALGSQQLCAQGLFSSPQQTSVAVAGTNQRQGVGTALFNSTNYAYFAGRDNILTVAVDTARNYTFSSVSHTAPQVSTTLNPAAVTLNGIVYVAYIGTNNAVYIMNSNDGVNFSSPVNIPVPGNVKIDGSLTIAAANNALYLGLHDGTNQAVITCSLTLSYAATCFKSSQGSTYGPGVAYFNGLLWAGAQSSNSSHTLVFGNQFLNSSGQITGPMSFNATGGSSDQTSGQPALFNEVGVNRLVFGFRSNDGSAQFLYKSYDGTSGAWTNSTGAGYAVGSPDLVGSFNGGITDVNVFVQNGYIASSYASQPQ